MIDKISLAACNGMSAYGLICRAVASDLSEDETNIISIYVLALHQLLRKFSFIK
ncbi:MAG: hypothetical protein KO202_06045 [Methanobacteriaceae archaeon]|jgi:hypothetical protein|nr:hypothetical protein [Methanobacteriaceae archaeon]